MANPVTLRAVPFMGMARGSAYQPQAGGRMIHYANRGDTLHENH